jgi:hypothetical protein
MKELMILIFIFLFSLLSQANACDQGVSVDEFCRIIEAQFKGDYTYRTPSNEQLPLDEIPEEWCINTCLHDGRGNVKSQVIVDPEYILMRDGDFKPSAIDTVSKFGIEMHKANSGTRTVGICRANGNNKFCFKQWPEAPGIEMAARQFFEMFMPDGEDVPIPRSVTIAINGQVFLVSEFIEGVPLRDFLNLIKDDDPCHFFDELSFQRLILFCMITNPEDCRLENCLVRKKSNGNYEIVLIDNERSFGREIVQSGVETRVHCVPFCFYSMLNRPPVLEHTLCSTLVSHAKLRERLFKLLNEQKYQLALQESLKEKGKPSILSLPLGEPFITNLAWKWSDITYKVIFEKKNLAKIFGEVMPLQLTTLYLTDPESGKSALDRIMEVDTGRNSESGTPASSWVSLPDYFFSKEPPTVDRLSGIFSEILQKYAQQFTAETIEEILSLIASLARQGQSHV